MLILKLSIMNKRYEQEFNEELNQNDDVQYDNNSVSEELVAHLWD